MPQRLTISMAAERGPYIDQSQSMSLYMQEPERNILVRGLAPSWHTQLLTSSHPQYSAHIVAWKSGLKTGLYYLRTTAPSYATQPRGRYPIDDNDDTNGGDSDDDDDDNDNDNDDDNDNSNGARARETIVTDEVPAPIVCVACSA